MDHEALQGYYNINKSSTHHWPALKDSAGLAIIIVNPITLADSFVTDNALADEVTYRTMT